MTLTLADANRVIAGAIEQQDAATREISQNAQLAAQGNGTLVVNIGSLSDAIGVTAYELTRDGLALATVTAPTTAYLDPSVAPSTTYTYAVRARDAAGNLSPFSTGLSVTTPAAPPQPLTVLATHDATIRVDRHAYHPLGSAPGAVDCDGHQGGGFRQAEDRGGELVLGSCDLLLAPRWHRQAHEGGDSRCRRRGEARVLAGLLVQRLGRAVGEGRLERQADHCQLAGKGQQERDRAEGLAAYRRFIEEAARLVVGYGGSLSGEHGDGRARGELLEVMYSHTMIRTFAAFKEIFDPEGLLNPGVIVAPAPLDADLALRELPIVETTFTFPHAHPQVLGLQVIGDTGDAVARPAPAAIPDRLQRGD